MDLEGKLKRAFSVCSENLAIFIPRALELALEIAMLLAFAVGFGILIGLTLSPEALSSLMDVESLLPELGARAFLLAAFIISGVLAFSFITLLVRAFARAAVIGMAEEALRGERTCLSSGWKVAKARGLDVLWASLITGIVIILILAAGMIPLLIGALAGAEGTLIFALGFFGLFTAILAALLFYVLTLFAPQEVVLEGKGALDGIRGSVEFVKGNVFDVIIYIAVVIGISIAVGVVTVGVFLPVSLLFGEAPFLGAAVNLFQNLLSIAIGLLLAPYYEAVKTAMVAGAREGSA